MIWKRRRLYLYIDKKRIEERDFVALHRIRIRIEYGIGEKETEYYTFFLKQQTSGLPTDKLPYLLAIAIVGIYRRVPIISSIIPSLAPPIRI